jgi:hypothetical protein
MGLLDEAIRDHLDLKRRRGADPAEVERAEREALGPVRRGPEEPPHLLDPAAAAQRDEADTPGWDEDEHAAESHDDPGFEAYDDEFDDDDEFHDEPGPAPIQLAPPPAPAPAPASAPEPLRFSDEVPDGPPSARDPYEPSTAEFFEAAPSAQEHLRATPQPPQNGERAPDKGAHEESDATAEFDVEAATADEHHEPAQVDEDVLEETPEFLSDTPDHDRLWFEQRPPRDFDFDG